MRLVKRVTPNLELLGDRPAATNGWKGSTAPTGVEFEAMEWALDLVTYDFSSAEGHTAVRAEVSQDIHLTLAVAPEDQFFTQAGDTKRLTRLYLSGTQHSVPLVWDHISSSKKCSLDNGYGIG